MVSVREDTRTLLCKKHFGVDTKFLYYSYFVFNDNEQYNTHHFNNKDSIIYTDSLKTIFDID